MSDIYNDTALYFHQKKIFFPNVTAEKSDQILEKLHLALNDFDTAQMGNEDYEPDETGLWTQAYRNVRDEIPPILEDLESEFKTILGIIEGET